MNRNSLRCRIKGNLFCLSSEKLEEIGKLMELLMEKDKVNKVVKMKGIWKGLGFEKIDNLEQDIRIMRNKIEEGFQERSVTWNI